ncbi:Calcyclin-binding protein [Fukomys damarensis]|uniref:Calcyclin-binding protein n=1 Tax=Fukomys damarensis TaxID=885580 RepID=A0A091CYP4_FUKDA|nr:Calcyclin-binding protein [Fukomys damarensis]
MSEAGGTRVDGSGLKFHSKQRADGGLPQVWCAQLPMMMRSMGMESTLGWAVPVPECTPAARAFDLTQAMASALEELQNDLEEVEEEYKEKEKPSYDGETDPSEGLMNVLKKTYEDGDHDMKRTINKAWVESREKQAKGDTEF